MGSPVISWLVKRAAAVARTTCRAVSVPPAAAREAMDAGLRPAAETPPTRYGRKHRPRKPRD